MSKAKKIWIIIGTVLIVLGLGVSVTAFAVMGFNVTKLNYQNKVTNTVEISKTFKNISITDSSSDIKISKSEDNKCRVVFFESDKMTHSARVEGDTLTITESDETHWYDYVMNFNFIDMHMEVYLPEKSYNKLAVNITSGDITVNDELEFSDADCKSTSGDVMVYADAKERLNARSTSGDVTVRNLSGGDISVSSTSGDAEIAAVKCNEFKGESTSGDIKVTDVEAKADCSFESTSGDVKLENVVAKGNLKGESTSGDVTLRSCDGSTAEFTSTSGDITGTLKTAKYFDASSRSGDVDVPNGDGGRCVVSTQSGDIDIDVEKN